MEALIIVGFIILSLMGIGAFMDLLTYLERPPKSKDMSQLTEVENKIEITEDLKKNTNAVKKDISKNRLTSEVINDLTINRIDSIFLNKPLPHINVKGENASLEITELSLFENTIKIKNEHVKPVSINKAYEVLPINSLSNQLTNNSITNILKNLSYNRLKDNSVIGIVNSISSKISKANFNSNIQNNLSKNVIDRLIIDINPIQSINIGVTNNLVVFEPGVPRWEHHYVYSYSEIERASVEQKEFYFKFRNSFLNEVYFDLIGNINYAFILLFDLLNEYEKYLDISKVESQIETLGILYPKTKFYGYSFLIKKMGSIDGNDAVSQLKHEKLNLANTDFQNN